MSCARPGALGRHVGPPSGIYVPNPMHTDLTSPRSRAAASSPQGGRPSALLFLHTHTVWVETDDVVVRVPSHAIEKLLKS